MSAPCPSDLLAPWREALERPESLVRDDLERFQHLLVKWQSAQNLVSRETLHEFWTRHVADSLQLLEHLPKAPGAIFDLGSGGGFPALPLAIAGKGGQSSFVLFESNQRKVAFLRAVIRELDLGAKVRAERIEAADSRETGLAEVITARALAPLDRLLALSAPLLRPYGKMIFLKGRDYRDELDVAGADWRFDVLIFPSATDPDGTILVIDRLVRKSA